MNNYIQISDDGVTNLVLLTVSLGFMLAVWILENAWRNDKRWIIPIFIFPPLIFAFIAKYWEENRAKCFFAALFSGVLILLSGVTGYNFMYRVGVVFVYIGFWPYYAYKYLITLI